MSDNVNEKKWISKRLFGVIRAMHDVDADGWRASDVCDLEKEFDSWIEINCPLLTDRSKAIIEALELAIAAMDRLDSNQDEDPEAVCNDDQLRAEMLWKAFSPVRKAWKEGDGG